MGASNRIHLGLFESDWHEICAAVIHTKIFIDKAETVLETALKNQEDRCKCAAQCGK